MGLSNQPDDIMMPLVKKKRQNPVARYQP